MNPYARLIGVLEMKAFRRARDADGWIAASVEIIGDVNGGGRCCVPIWPETEVDTDVRLLRLRRRDKARQPSIGGDVQAGCAMLDERAQVLLLFGPPSIVTPSIVAVLVIPATAPKTLRTGVK